MSEPRNALTLLNPPGIYDPAPNGYSHIGIVQAGTRLAFIAGQGGETAEANWRLIFINRSDRR
jgi:hypothetical protein